MLPEKTHLTQVPPLWQRIGAHLVTQVTVNVVSALIVAMVIGGTRP